LLDVGPDFDRIEPAAGDPVEALHDVAHLGLDHEQDRVVAEPRVGPDEREEIGVAGHGHAPVPAGAVLPVVGQPPTAAATDIGRLPAAERREAGGQHDHVAGVRDAVVGHHRIRLDRGDRPGHDRDVRPGHRGIEIVRQEDALAAQRVERVQGQPQRGIGDLPLLEPGRPFLAPPHQLRFVDEAEGDRLGPPILERPAGGERSGHVPEEQAGQAGDRTIVAGEHPRGRPLEERQAADARGDGGHHLHRTGARADDGHPPAGEFHVVPPAGGVEHGAGEPVEAGDVRGLRLVQHPRGGDDGPGAEPAAVRGRQPPEPGIVVPLECGDRRLMADEPIDAESGGDLAQVAENLRLGCVATRPVGRLGERERVQVRGHVAAGARVGVVPPRAADGGRFLEDRSVPCAAPAIGPARFMWLEE